MSRSSRRRWNEFQKQQTLKALLPSQIKTPDLSQVETVQHNPFLPPENLPQHDAEVKTHANLTQQYVPSRTTGWYPFLQAQLPYIDDLTIQFGADFYDQMLADPIIYSGIRIFKLGILSNGFDLVPSLTSDEPDYDIAVLMRDFVLENLENLQTPYIQVLEQHLNALIYGANVSEQSYEPSPIGKKYLNLTSNPYLLRLTDIREKPLINTIFVVDSFFNTIGIMTQRFPGQNFPAGSYIPIPFASVGGNEQPYNITDHIPGFLPRSKFSVLTNEPRYNDERGKSTLRTAYQAWWMKQQGVAEYLAFISKFASPSLVGETAPNAQPQQLLNSDLTPQLDSSGAPMMLTPEQALSEALLAFQNGSALAIPSGAKITPIAVGGDGAAFINLLNWCNREMTYAITYQALATQEGLHQARASSETHQDILTIGILYRKQWLATQQYREVFKRLLMYNFDMTGKKIARYIPRLNLGLGDGFPVSPEAIARLMTSGYLDSSQLPELDKRQGLPVREKQTQVNLSQATQQQIKPPNSNDDAIQDLQDQVNRMEQEL